MLNREYVNVVLKRLGVLNDNGYVKIMKDELLDWYGWSKSTEGMLKALSQIWFNKVACLHNNDKKQFSSELGLIEFREKNQQAFLLIVQNRVSSVEFDIANNNGTYKPSTNIDIYRQFKMAMRDMSIHIQLELISNNLQKKIINSQIENAWKIVHEIDLQITSDFESLPSDIKSISELKSKLSEYIGVEQKIKYLTFS